MSGLKEVSYFIYGLALGFNKYGQLLNIMVSGRGLSSKGLTTREFKYDLSEGFSSRWKSSFQDKIDELVSAKLQE